MTQRYIYIFFGAIKGVISRRRHKVATETINSPLVWHFSPTWVLLRILSFIRSVVSQLAVEAKRHHLKQNIDSNWDSWHNKWCRRTVVKLPLTLTASRGQLQQLWTCGCVEPNEKVTKTLKWLLTSVAQTKWNQMIQMDSLLLPLFSQPGTDTAL